MWEILSRLSFDGFSFWLGALLGAVICLLFWRIRSWMRGKRENNQISTKVNQSDLFRNDLLQLNNDTLVRAQGWHIASDLFSLDEIAIEPRLMAPPVSPITQFTGGSSDITDWAIPYMPDWPEMAAAFGTPTLSIADGLKGGCHLAITGQPGTGKTVALAYLASQLIRKSTGLDELKKNIPILLHAGDLYPIQDTSIDVLAPIMQAVTDYAAPETVKRLPKFLPKIFEDGRAIILLDGLDEFPPALFDPFVEYISRLLHAFPNIRIVVSSSSSYVDGLLNLDFFPIPLAGWSREQKLKFIQQWNNSWFKQIDNDDAASKPSAESLLLIGWLMNELIPHTPLELTLKAWAASAGDSLGAKPQDAIEAHLRRLTCRLPDQARLALEQMALQMVRYMHPIILRADVEDWLAGSLSAPIDANEDLSVLYSVEDQRNPSQKDRIRAPGALSGLIENGLIRKFNRDRMSIRHPVFTGYLAGEALIRVGEAAQLVLQPEWSGKSLALKFFCSRGTQIDFLEGVLKNASSDILMRDLFNIARWLSEAEESVSWSASVMRQLATCLQKENLPLSLKGQALSALVCSGKSSVQLLVRQMLESPHNDLRQLGVLGCGMIRDQGSGQKIISLLSDRSPHVRLASVLGLVAIRDRSSLEAVGGALLHGDETLRRAAAEALANHPEEGYPALKEGSAHTDPLVRRAVVFGLKRVKQDWAVEILEKLRAEDTQWIVQDAASQALVEIGQSDPHIPAPLPEITQAPWLIRFAAELNMSIPAGRAGIELMYRSIKKGDEEQVLSSIYYLGFKGDEGSVAPLYHAYFAAKGELREITLNALHNLASSGVPMPSPSYFGLA